jgi:hypothetical protein
VTWNEVTGVDSDRYAGSGMGADWRSRFGPSFQGQRFA